MSRVYKTARGKLVDMDRIKLSNEDAVAIGNMRVNARGDLLGSGNQVATGRNEVMDRVYAVPDAPAEGYTPNNAKQRAARQIAAEATKAKALHDLANNLVVPTEPEPTEDNGQPVTRGALASSVAKKAVVTQGPIPDPRKPKGPSRI